MSHQATVLYVMISSPADVRGKGGIDFVKQAISEWNTLYTEKEKVALVAMDWKDAYPKMGIATTGQKTINEQILERCDILIALFWSQIGTPTENFASGSVEELEIHIQAGKQAMVYFFTEALPENSDLEQKRKLNEFKAQCQARGLYRELDRIDTPMKKGIMDDIYKYIATQNFQESLVQKSDTSETSARLKSLYPPLSATARQRLLLAAVDDKDGVILRSLTLSEPCFYVASQAFGRESSRDFARYEDARDELIKNGLLDASRDPKGNVARLTRAGWELADKLKGT